MDSFINILSLWKDFTREDKMSSEYSFLSVLAWLLQRPWFQSPALDPHPSKLLLTNTTNISQIIGRSSRF